MKSSGVYSESPVHDLFSIPDLLMVICIVAAFFFLLFIYRRHKTIRFGFLRGIVVMCCGFGIIFSFDLRGDNRFIAILTGIVAMTITDILLFPSQKRSTYIPRSERRKVIDTFEVRRGKKFDPQRHGIECIIPVSKGGKLIADNLRVVRKSDRAKAHWWESLG